MRRTCAPLPPSQRHRCSWLSVEGHSCRSRTVAAALVTKLASVSINVDEAVKEKSDLAVSSERPVASCLSCRCSYEGANELELKESFIKIIAPPCRKSTTMHPTRKVPR